MNIYPSKSSSKRYFYMYMTVNTVNNKYYVGVRSSIVPPSEDNYIGSGKRLKDAIKHYGRRSFVKIIMETFDTFEQAFEKEAEVVNEDFVAQHDTYNMCVGGSGGDHWSKLPNRDEIISKNVENRKKTVWNLTPEERQQKFARTHWNGRSHNDTTKQLLSDINGSWDYCCVSPDGDTYRFRGLRKFCSDHGLSMTAFRKYANTGHPIPPYTMGPKSPSRFASTGWTVSRDQIWQAPPEQAT